MKKLYFLVVALCVFNGLNAQIVNIPDANFKAKLLVASSSNTTAKDLAGNYFKIDSNSDGQIQESEALQVSQLNVNSSLIYDLTGISSFSAIQHLECNYNILRALNVSGLSNLQHLECNNNKLQTLNVSGLSNLQYLNCLVNLISTIDVSGLTSLQTLICSYNKITLLDATSITNLKKLDCRSNELSELNINGLLNLIELNCLANLLPTLNVSGLTNLQILDCQANLLPTLNVSGLTNLQTLTCSQNQLPSIDLSGLTNLKILNCSRNILPFIDVDSLTSLQTLNCSYNKITSLDISKLVNLTLLDCVSNLLLSLDASGLTNLETLACSRNSLTTLNVGGSTNLKSLYCVGNQLPELNLGGLTKLQLLICSENLLPSLNVSDLTNLSSIFCPQNKLSSLDVSGLTKLQTLDCSSNLLTSLFIKNGLQETNLNFSNNPNLKFICADTIQLIQVQNLITQYGYTDCSMNSYCSFVPGGIFYTIQGTQKLDSNANGCDALDIFIPNLKFSISDGTTTGSLIPNSTGNYSIAVSAGTHTITPVVENPTYFHVSPTTVSVTFPAQTSPFVQDYCITANGVHPDLEVSMLPLIPAIAGFDAKYKLVYKNKGNQTQSGTVNLSFNDAVLDLVLSNPVSTTQTTNTLSWDFTNLLPFETREVNFTLNLNSPIESPSVDAGSVLVYNATITSAAADETPTDNIFSYSQTVVNSFDPNDKTCLEGATISPSLIGQYVHYMIRFENNGTANAQNIVVKDIIDLSKFDISSLIPTDASHSFVTNISAGNKVEFIFENIHLPFDDANNDGYIAFKIKTLPTLVVGNTFTNDARIYFDYNFPIVTKLASSTFKTLTIQDFEFANYFTLYPNPVQSVLNISSKEAIEVKSLSIYNTLGQLVLVVTNADKVSKIDVSSLTTGNYFIKINSDKGTSNTRFIKE